MVFENSDEDGSWRKLCNELHNLYSLLNVVTVIKSCRLRWVEYAARVVEGRGVYRILVGRPKVKRLLGRPRCKWAHNIKLDLREIRIDEAK
jgi:hypothetical protein